MIKAIILLYITKSLITSFEYQNSSPESLFPYNSAAIEYSIPGNITNPAYLPLIDYSYINFSGDNPYSLEDIYTSNIRAGTSFTDSGIQAAWSRFGIEEYRENSVEFNAGFRLCKWFSTGAGFNYYNLSIDTESINLSKNLYDVRLSILCNPVKWIDISFLQENVSSLIDDDRTDLLYPGWSLGTSVRPIRGLSLTWNINKTPFGYLNSFSIKANILSFMSLSGGYCRESTTYSTSFSFIYKHISVSYGLKYHSYLGATHSIGFTLTDSSVKFNSLDYRNKLSKKSPEPDQKKININKCAIQELKEIPVLTDTFSERIIKYRNMIGPVTKKSLFQIGMTGKEVNDLLEYIYGLHNEQNEKNKKYNKNRYKKFKRYSQKTRKGLFQKLLSAGIRASTALRLSELTVQKNKKELISTINSIPDISKEKKREIKRLCTKSLSQ